MDPYYFLFFTYSFSESYPNITNLLVVSIFSVGSFNQGFIKGIGEHEVRWDTLDLIRLQIKL